MMGWITENSEKIGAGILAVGGIVGVMWAKLQSMRTDKAKTGADVAIAESQREVYEQMKERLTDMSAQIERLHENQESLRSQLRAREDELHRWQMHVKDMEHLLVQHGIPVPVMPS